MISKNIYIFTTFQTERSNGTSALGHNMIGLLSLAGSSAGYRLILWRTVKQRGVSIATNAASADRRSFQGR